MTEGKREGRWQERTEGREREKTKKGGRKGWMEEVGWTVRKEGRKEEGAGKGGRKISLKIVKVIRLTNRMFVGIMTV